MKTEDARAFSRGSKAFTLTEVLIVAAVIAVLTMLFFPVLKNGFDSAANARCVSNLRSLGQASMAYASENNGKLPVPERWGLPADELYWWRILRPYLPEEEYIKYGMPNLFRCPKGEGYKKFVSGSRGGSWSLTDYATVLLYPGNTQYTTHKVQPTQAPLLVDGENYDGYLGVEPSTFNSIVSARAQARHRNGVNVLFVDGHIEPIKKPTASMFFPVRN